METGGDGDGMRVCGQAWATIEAMNSQDTMGNLSDAPKRLWSGGLRATGRLR